MTLVLAGDRDRERATAALREHYVRGRLTLDEVSERTATALGARSRAELRTALADLPAFPDRRELAAHARSVARGAMLVVLSGVYLLFSVTLLLIFALTLLIQGASAGTLLGFLLVWLVPTYLLARLWRREPRRD